MLALPDLRDELGLEEGILTEMRDFCWAGEGGMWRERDGVEGLELETFLMFNGWVSGMRKEALGAGEGLRGKSLGPEGRRELDEEDIEQLQVLVAVDSR